MPKLIDLTGKQFGRLIVIGRAENAKNGNVRWYCQCDCGEIVIVGRKELRSGDTNSCGCLKKEIIAALNMKHGESNTRLFRIWAGMKSRATNPNVKDFKYYGEKGVTVCEEWENNFKAFEKWALSNAYSDDLTIDRINSDKEYSPDNCRWADIETQNNNKRNNHYLTHNRKTMTIAEWAKEIGISDKIIRNRLRRGWTIEKALTTPVKKQK